MTFITLPQKCVKTVASCRIFFILIFSYTAFLLLFYLPFSDIRAFVRRHVFLMSNDTHMTDAMCLCESAKSNRSYQHFKQMETTKTATSSTSSSPLRSLSKMLAMPGNLGKPCPDHVTAARAKGVRFTAHRDMPLQAYLNVYRTYCCLVYKHGDNRLPPCPCVPYKLTGELNTSETSVHRAARHIETPALGGSWRPGDCSARHRVAVIIPYRDRERHLTILLDHLHAILQRQMLDYTIIVSEQRTPSIFNKASLMNVAYLETRRLGNFDCYIFHDVDVLAENDMSFYTCVDQPRHVGAYLEKYNYTVLYQHLFGAITAFTPAQFEKVNGFSNIFYGWGGEDDDMAYRIHHFNMKIIRFPKSVARYRMIVHKKDKLNPVNKHRRMVLQKANVTSRILSGHGLTSVVYNISSVSLNRQYTHFVVDLPGPPLPSSPLTDKPLQINKGIRKKKQATPRL